MQPNEVLSDGVRASAGVRSRKLSQGLVVAETALAVTLVASAAILLWHFHDLKVASPGFDPSGVLTFQVKEALHSDSGIAGAGAGFNQTAESAATLSAYSDTLLEALAAIPGVSAAALTNQLPLNGCCLSGYVLPEGRSSSEEPRKLVSILSVSSDYFRTVRIPLLAGRLLGRHDTSENPVAVVIDEKAAKQLWPRSNAVGQFARFSAPDGSRCQVVGVVGSVQNEGVGEVSVPEVYLLKNLIPPSPIQFVVRSQLSPAVLVSSIRSAIARVAPNQPIFAIRTLTAIANGSLFLQRIQSTIVSVFALAALLLAALGIYGLTSYSVRQRTTELGTRMALGATGSQILELVVRSGLFLAGYGLVGGAFTAIGASVLVVRYLNVHHLDVAPYLVTALITLLLAAVASFVPGWRASLLSPMLAIRNEIDPLSSLAQHAWQRVRTSILVAEEPGSKFDVSLLTEFVEASRRAESFAEALSASLEHLRTEIGAEWAFLLQKIAAGEYRCRASVPARSASEVFLIPDGGFLSNRLRFYAGPLPFTAADWEVALLWARTQKSQLVPELELLEQLGLRLAAPLRTKHETIGLLLFGESLPSGEIISLPKQKFILACAEQLALTLENARLNERLLEQEKVRRDLALATEVQKRLLPELAPSLTGTSIDAFTLAARSVGGDYYDFLDIGGQRIGIALADIAGKGIAAALIMAVVQASLRILASQENVSLPSLVSKMNSFLHRSTGSSSYATFFYAQLDPVTRRLRYVNAGHNPPYLVRSVKTRTGSESVLQIKELAAGGMIIGMFPFANYEEAEVDLQPGDILMIFTDGVTEALNPNEEEFGEERLQDLLRQVAHLPIREITAAIASNLRNWIAEAPQHDDMTFVLLKVDEEPLN